MAVQVFVGGEFETQSVHNMTQLVDEGYRRGIPVLGVTAVGKELVRDSRYLGLATRMCAELGAQIVKTYYCERVRARHGRLPRADRHGRGQEAARARGTRPWPIGPSRTAPLGVDMGRNIFQCEAPIAMLTAVRKVVHEGYTPAQALEVFQTLRHDAAPALVAAGA